VEIRAPPGWGIAAGKTVMARLRHRRSPGARIDQLPPAN
jgi:hypothetical protein